MCDIRSYISWISSIFDYDVFVLVAVQQLKRFPNLK